MHRAAGARARVPPTELRCAVLRRERCLTLLLEASAGLACEGGTSRLGSATERSMGDAGDDTSYCMKRVRVLLERLSLLLPVD